MGVFKKESCVHFAVSITQSHRESFLAGAELEYNKLF